MKFASDSVGMIRLELETSLKPLEFSQTLNKGVAICRESHSSNDTTDCDKGLYLDAALSCEPILIHVGFPVPERDAKFHSFIGRIWPHAQWKITTADRYAGHFKAKNKISQFCLSTGNMTPVPYPILLRAVCQRMLLTRGGHGHKFFRHPSTCTAKAVRSDFIDGKLPKKRTVYRADLGAFEVLGVGGVGAGSHLEDEL
ncbi:hypothetical protein BDFG_04416 [Blastomyces dermatitidis ATCC 26199]|nr:hypothetical protein BDFG_04416 [Blastomyces dermatitidis ATCC 26199]